jgi:hypothetical protein
MPKAKTVPIIPQKDRPENGGKAGVHDADHGPITSGDSQAAMDRAATNRSGGKLKDGS